MATIDSYSESNYSAGALLYTAGNNELSQTFYCTSGNILTAAKFYLQKYGSPTGNITAKVYAVTGTPGTNAVPTGSALATSDAVDISTLSASYTVITFSFSGAEQIELSSATWYAVAVRYAEGNSVNRLNVGTDTSDPAHGGNYAYYAGSWTYLTDRDLCFYVEGDELPPGYFNDSCHVNEAITVGLDDSAISVVESASVAESVTMFSGMFMELSITETATLTESVGVLAVPILYVDINDTCGVVDVASPALSAIIIVSKENLYAPVSTLSAEMGQRFDVSGISPESYAEGIFGSELVEMAPVSTCAGSITSAVSMALNKKSPVASVIGYFGSYVDGDVSAQTCEGSLLSDWMYGDAYAPVSVATGSMYEEAVMSLDKKSPFALLSSTMYCSSMVMQGTSPASYLLDCVMYWSSGWILDAKAPVSFASYGDMTIPMWSIRGDMTAPVGTMSCDTGFGDTDSAELSDVGRFSSYTLEYAR